MGNQCLATTPNEKYSSFLKQIKVAQLKDLWENVKIYKLKKLFDSVATPQSGNPKNLILNFEGFKKLFTQLECYPQQQLCRLFEIFDFQNSGQVDWDNFFSVVTILYFGSEKTLALIMFMIFDLSLELRLDNVYLKLMLQTNQDYFKLTGQGEIQEACQIYHHLMSQDGLSVQLWLKQALKIVDFSKFRKIFNIFMEQKLEKELIRNFYEWNEVYNTQKEKYVGYLINIKWFQSWRLYISHHYDINIEIYSLNKSAIKTVKTCKKTFNRLRTVKLGIDTSRVLHGCRYIQVGPNKIVNIKNIDCVHNHLGERPRQITNNQLQGQIEEVLRQGVSQNMDYAIVSEKVWNHLKSIYDGFPEFRRTGYDSIELYPKIIKTYFSFFKGRIDYSAQVLRQVSAYLRIDQMLINSCEVSEEQLKDKVIYFKTIGMQRWEQIDDPACHFTELSSEVLIFLVCTSKEDRQSFHKSHQKQPKDVLQINLGDYVTYCDSHGKQKDAIFMGKSTEGKYILHFSGQSYMSDVCLMQVEMLKYCKLSVKLEEIEHQKRTFQNSLIGLPSSPGLGFINSSLQILMNSKDVKKQLAILDDSRNDKFIYCLAKIHNLLTKQGRIDAIDVKDVIDLYFNKYVDFQVGFSYSFLNDLFAQLTRQIKVESIPNILSGYQLQVEKIVDCLHCKSKTNFHQNSWALKVPIPQDKMSCYEVTWVPINSLNSSISKYKIIIKKQATLIQFMNALQAQIGIINKTYILAEVYSNDIVKNYHTAQRSATLANLKMRQTDQLYVYQLQTDMSEFVHKHFKNKTLLEQQQIKKDMFIDCKHPQRGWIFGKVMEVEYLSYIHNSIVKVLHKFNKNQSWEINYDVFDDSIARFPNRSYDNCQQYHLRLQQRIFNQPSNSMKLVNVPLIIVLPAWMRWKEFFYYVFVQLRKFISAEYDLAHEQVNMDKSHKNIKSGIKLDDFRQYKNGKKFPYKLHLSDFEGRCATCFKFLKLVVFKGQNDTYCEGCQLSQSQPISWQVKPADLLICIDWISTDRFKSDFKSQSSSYTKSSHSKKQDDTLSKCLESMERPSLRCEQALCCNIFSQKHVIERVVNSPNMLTIYLQRLVQEDDGFKKLIKKQIKFPIKQLLVNSKKYNLMGITSIEGQHLNIRHKSYIYKSDKQWYEYDGKLVRLVQSKYVQKVCAFVLYYQKVRDS